MPKVAPIPEKTKKTTENSKPENKIGINSVISCPFKSASIETAVGRYPTKTAIAKKLTFTKYWKARRPRMPAFRENPCGTNTVKHVSKGMTSIAYGIPKRGGSK